MTRAFQSRFALSCAAGAVLLLGGCESMPWANKDGDAMRATPPAETTPPPVETTAAGEIRYRVADSHFHLVDFLQGGDGIHAALAAMDVAGVDHTMVSGMPLVKKWNAADPRKPLYYLEDDSRAYWYSATDVLVANAIAQLAPADRKRFHPFICGFNGTDKNAVDHIRRMLEWYPGLWHGIGEVMGRHDDLTALTYGEAARADHEGLDAVYALGAELDLPVSVHSNIGSVWRREPVYKHEVDNMCKRHPKTRFIWCHAGISRRIDIPDLTDHLRDLLRRHENLWMDLSWVVFEDYIAPNGEAAPEWVKLIEEFPDRFMVGSDKVARFSNLHEQIMKYYVLLDALKPETARKVAKDNFLSVLPQAVREGLGEPVGAAGAAGR
jgi:predicted TIM-barrel fold metal-dependent hydrolase